MKQKVAKFITFAFFESAYQLNIQSAGLALNVAVAGHVDKPTLVSILLSLFVAAYNFYKEAAVFYWIWKTLGAVDCEALTLEDERKKREQGRWHEANVESNRVRHKKLEDDRRVMCRWALVFLGVGIFYVMLVVRGAFQTFMAASPWGGCRYGLHNIGQGCVEPPSALQ